MVHLFSGTDERFYFGNHIKKRYRYGGKRKKAEAKGEASILRTMSDSDPYPV